MMRCSEKSSEKEPFDALPSQIAGLCKYFSKQSLAPRIKHQTEQKQKASSILTWDATWNSNTLRPRRASKASSDLSPPFVTPRNITAATAMAATADLGEALAETTCGRRDDAAGSGRASQTRPPRLPAPATRIFHRCPSQARRARTSRSRSIATGDTAKITPSGRRSARPAT